MIELSQRVLAFRESLSTNPIMHPAFEVTATKLIDAIYTDKERPIINVSGPPGIGKTQLIRYVLAKIIESESKAMESDLEYIPIVGIRVPSVEQGTFPWKDTYHTMIEGLFDPASRAQVHFREYKTKDTQRGLEFEFRTEKYLGRGTKQTLYRHFLRIREHRRPKAIIMDEAHHFVYGSRNLEERLETLANRLKSMADEMDETKLVLVWCQSNMLHYCLYIKFECLCFDECNDEAEKYYRSN